MKSAAFVKKAIIGLMVAGLSACAWGAYRTTGTSTEPNVWTRNYSGVLAAAKQTGYPILIVIVNSATCGHCHILNQLTLNSSAFAQMERELTFYKLMMDAPNGGEFQTTVNRYYSYFNYGMYPIIGVLRKDGSMYGSFGNRTTDGRDVTADVRSLIERLATEQGADIWSGSGATPTPYVPPKPTAAEWAAKLKGKTNGLLFDGNQNLTGSFAASLTSNGRMMARITTRTGNETVRGNLTLANDMPQVKSEGLSLVYNEKTGVWSGSWRDFVVLAGAASSKSYAGLYTVQAANSSGTKAGCLTVTLNKTGKGKVSGLLNGRNKISASGNAVVLPASVIADNLPAWYCAFDAAFVAAVKRGAFAGGMAIAKDGTARGKMSAFGIDWEATGAKFGASDLTPLKGQMLKIRLPSGLVEVAITTKNNSKQIATVANDYTARVTAMVKKGTFKGSAKINGVRLSFEGVLLAENGSIRGEGVSYGPGGVHPVSIGPATPEPTPEAEAPSEAEVE